MRNLRGLRALFVAILLGMLAVTIWASGHENVLVGGRKVIAEPWALATLADAYAGFFTFFAWVYYKERSGLARALWFVAIMFLGNIAMAAYVLRELGRLAPGAGAAELLTRGPTA